MMILRSKFWCILVAMNNPSGLGTLVVLYHLPVGRAVFTRRLLPTVIGLYVVFIEDHVAHQTTSKVFSVMGVCVLLSLRCSSQCELMSWAMRFVLESTFFKLPCLLKACPCLSLGKPDHIKSPSVGV